MKLNKRLLILSFVFLLFVITGCKQTAMEEQKETKILIAAAASLEYSFKDKLIPLFEEKHPNIKVEATYDSSGKLQKQIEEGLEADVFMSAAMKQMQELDSAGLLLKDSMIELLENKIVLIEGINEETGIDGFERITEAKTIAIGDPESVPVGQYAEEALRNLGIWELVIEKATLGTNVTEVLGWVAECSAEVGIVYATDAATTDKVRVIAEAPIGSLDQKVIYPVGIVKQGGHEEEARLFVEFLASKEALQIFEEYGFTPN